MDITETCSIQNLCFVDLGNLMDYNEIILTHSYFKYDGAIPSLYSNTIFLDIKKVTAMNVFYVADTIHICNYPYFGIDTSILDLTISSLDSSLVSVLNQDLSIFGITVRSMYLNFFEFVLVFNLLDAIEVTDINLSLGTMTNEFQNNYLIKKIDVGRSMIAFKFYQNIK